MQFAVESATTKKVRLLIVEDNLRDARLLVDTLRNARYEPEADIVSDRASFEEQLQRDCHDLILCDYNLRDWTAVDALDSVRKAGVTTPLVIVSGSVGDAAAADLLYRGATDFLLKDRLARLPLAIEKWIKCRKGSPERRARKRLRMLIAEDNANDVRMVVESLRSVGYDVIFDVAKEIRDFDEKIQKQKYDILLCDHDMGNWNAVDALALLRTSGQEVPLVVVSGVLDDAAASDLIRLGACDYVLKDRLSRLPAAIQQAIEHRELVAESKRMEAAQRESERRLAEVYEHIDDVIVYLEIVPPGGFRFAYVNPAYCKTTGIKESQVVGKLMQEVMPEPTLSNSIAKCREAIRTRTTVRWEETAQFPTGTKTGLVAVTPVFAPDGRALYLVSTAHDITDRKAAEQALLTSEQRFQSYMDHSPAVAWMKDEEGRYVYMNRAFEALIGKSVSDLLGKTDLDIFPPQVGRAFQKNDQQVLQSGESAQFEETTIVGGKTQFWWSFKFRFVDGAGNKYVAGMALDITDRKEAEATLNLQSSALNAAANAIMITDTNGIIEWVNTAFSTLTGYMLEEAIGKNPRDLLKSGAHHREFFKNLWDTILAGHVWEGELTNRRKDGSLYPEAMTITPVKDAAGNVTHFIAIKRDLTEQRQLQAQFLAAQKMEAIGQLAGGIAHDFNNYLNVIMGYSELWLEKAAPDDPMRRNAEIILATAKNAASVTRQLLAFGRRQIFQPRLMDVNETITEMLSMLRPLIGETIEVVTTLDPLLGMIDADPSQIGQILMNLAVNARDAMPKGGRLEITTRNAELDEAYAHGHLPLHPGPYVMISVSDTGTGMSKEVQEKIFEPFYTTKEQGEGTGLGLATVYGIVKQSKGFIWVYSELGKGTTFKLYFPRCEKQQQRPRKETVAAAARSGERTVLVAEDDGLLRELTIALLQSDGYTVLDASSGEQALKVASEYRGSIDLLLTDTVMPGMGGRELADSLTALRPTVRVLFTSDDAVLRYGVAGGEHAFLEKPYSKEQLLRSVQAVLRS